MGLNKKSFVIASGVTFGVFLAWIVFFGGLLGWEQAGGSPILANIIVGAYPWLDVSLRGVLLTFFWGFVDGAAVSFLFVTLYEHFLKGEE